MKRIGFHYYPDTQHYRQNDLETWLPELTALGASWLVLQAPPDRAIPEPFLKGLLEAGIEPVLHVDCPPDRSPAAEDLVLLCKAYEKWGLRYITLFNKPNLRSTWQSTNWAQIDLVERFLDIYLPLAEACVNSGLIPIYPPLEPGGDYWDTAFLRASLRGIKRRRNKDVLDKLVIGAIARTGNHPLNWGTGGPERWPGVRPYFTPDGTEDHRAFRIFDWYNAYSQSILVDPLPLFLFEVGSVLPDTGFEKDLQTNMVIAQLLAEEDVPGMEPIPDNVIGSAFWFLAATTEDPLSPQAWYKSSTEPLPVAEALRNFVGGSQKEETSPKTGDYAIAHYLLLPSFDEGISDVHFDLIRPFVKKFKPTIGFSIPEAQRAQRVTVIGGPELYPDMAVNQLRSAGCIVKQIEMDGIDIASFLSD